MKTQFSIKSAIIAGLAATVAMTAFTYMAPLMGFEMNIPKMLANSMGAPIIVGWLAHFMVGVILAINYGLIFLSSLNKKTNIKNGMIYGLIPWLISQVMVMPMMNLMNQGNYLDGLFSGSLMVAMASLVGHLIFGAVLGKIYKPETIAVSVTV